MVFKKCAAILCLSLFSLPLWAGEIPVVIRPITTGMCRSNFKYMVAGGKSEEVRIPTPVYVIFHPKGVVLVDSGLGEEFPEQMKSWWVYRFFQKLLPEEFDRSQSALQQIKNMGIDPRDVRFIVVTHLHFDHAGGLRDFPNAKVVLSRDEWNYAHVNRWRAAFLRGVRSEQLEGLESRLQFVTYKNKYGPFEGSYDLFGDGAILLLPTHGHTPGHQSVLVTLSSGRKVLITGDAAWVKENYEWPAPKSWLVRSLEEDQKKTWESLLRIKKFHEQNPNALIFPGHDPHLWPQWPAEIR